MKLMEEAGFKADVRGQELVFRRTHHLDPSMSVKVYSSLPARGGDVRGCGEDAIRIFLIWERGDASGCLYKTSRVFRTGSEQGVLERVLDRIREAYAAGTLRHQRVPKDQIEERAKAMAEAKKEAQRVKKEVAGCRTEGCKGRVEADGLCQACLDRYYDNIAAGEDAAGQDLRYDAVNDEFDGEET